MPRREKNTNETVPSTSYKTRAPLPVPPPGARLVQIRKGGKVIATTSESSQPKRYCRSFILNGVCRLGDKCSAIHPDKEKCEQVKRDLENRESSSFNLKDHLERRRAEQPSEVEIPTKRIVTIDETPRDNGNARQQQAPELITLESDEEDDTVVRDTSEWERKLVEIRRELAELEAREAAAQAKCFQTADGLSQLSQAQAVMKPAQSQQVAASSVPLSPAQPTVSFDRSRSPDDSKKQKKKDKKEVKRDKDRKEKKRKKEHSLSASPVREDEMPAQSKETVDIKPPLPTHVHRASDDWAMPKHVHRASDDWTAPKRQAPTPVPAPVPLALTQQMPTTAAPSSVSTKSPNRDDFKTESRERHHHLSTQSSRSTSQAHSPRKDEKRKEEKREREHKRSHDKPPKEPRDKSHHGDSKEEKKREKERKRDKEKSKDKSREKTDDSSKKKKHKRARSDSPAPKKRSKKSRDGQIEDMHEGDRVEHGGMVFEVRDDISDSDEERLRNAALASKNAHVVEPPREESPVDEPLPTLDKLHALRDRYRLRRVMPHLLLDHLSSSLRQRLAETSGMAYLPHYDNNNENELKIPRCPVIAEPVPHAKMVLMRF